QRTAIVSRHVQLHFGSACRCDRTARADQRAQRIPDVHASRHRHHRHHIAGRPRNRGRSTLCGWRWLGHTDPSRESNRQSHGGEVQFISPDGTAANVTIEGQTESTFAYSVAGRSSQKLMTAGVTLTRTSGSVRIIPNGGPIPTPLVLFSSKPAMVTVSEAGVPVTSG